MRIQLHTQPPPRNWAQPFVPYRNSSKLTERSVFGTALLNGVFSLALAMAATGMSSEPLWSEAEMITLRSGDAREWDTFPERVESREHEYLFRAAANVAAATISWRQSDVKQTWHVVLNERRLSNLTRDENAMRVYAEVPAGGLAHENTLRITAAENHRASDDIRFGDVRIDGRPLDQVLHEANVTVRVVDENGQPTPCRLTIVDSNDALQTVGADSNPQLAVRPGTVYTSSGTASFGVPAGRYRIFAGRGFEYSRAETNVELIVGATTQVDLSIRRVVPTEGYVACDTHTHTLTHSGHGDATIQERMVTLAGEGIELPIATDHNVHIDQTPFAETVGVRRYFTPVIGNEVTTRVGHFNVFPIQAGATPPPTSSQDWREILDGIFRTPHVKVAILNHGRDLHSGVRPLGPDRFNDVAGETTNGAWMGFNAMEVVNSAAIQSDVLQLFHDWMAILNSGRSVTPVGSSDSHDVARHFVGQGRTYIRCEDGEPGRIDVEQAVRSFLQGNVLVSYGLMTELTVNGKYRSGELAITPDDAATLDLRILGPNWVQPERILVYANGQLWREAAVVPPEDGDGLPEGVLWENTWKYPRSRQDVHLVAIALGKGIDHPAWVTAKPYQPTSSDWVPQVVGCSGAVWLDGDGDGRRTSARDYARRVVDRHAPQWEDLFRALSEYDSSVAAQAAWLIEQTGVSPLDRDLQSALAEAAPQVQDGMRRFLEAWRRGMQSVP